MIPILFVVDSEDLGGSNPMNSSTKSKIWNKDRKIDNHFKRCFIAQWIKYSHCNLKLMVRFHTCKFEFID